MEKTKQPRLTLEEKIRLTELSEHASDLIVDIMDEPLPAARIPTLKDLDFIETLNKIYRMSPLLADGYTAVTGKDCGCDNRQRWLNAHFPLK